MKNLLNFLKCIADENRFKILKLLLDDRHCVCQLQELLGKSQSSVSQHLSYFKDLELLNEEQDGKWIFYSINRDQFDKFLAELITLKANSLEKLQLNNLAEKRKTLNSPAQIKNKQRGCC